MAKTKEKPVAAAAPADRRPLSEHYQELLDAVKQTIKLHPLANTTLRDAIAPFVQRTDLSALNLEQLTNFLETYEQSISSLSSLTHYESSVKIFVNLCAIGLVLEKLSLVRHFSTLKTLGLKAADLSEDLGYYGVFEIDSPELYRFAQNCRQTLIDLGEGKFKPNNWVVDVTFTHSIADAIEKLPVGKDQIKKLAAERIPNINESVLTKSAIKAQVLTARIKLYEEQQQAYDELDVTQRAAIPDLPPGEFEVADLKNKHKLQKFKLEQQLKANIIAFKQFLTRFIVPESSDDGAVSVLEVKYAAVETFLALTTVPEKDERCHREWTTELQIIIDAHQDEVHKLEAEQTSELARLRQQLEEKEEQSQLELALANRGALAVELDRANSEVALCERRVADYQRQFTKLENINERLKTEKAAQVFESIKECLSEEQQGAFNPKKWYGKKKKLKQLVGARKLQIQDEQAQAETALASAQQVVGDKAREDQENESEISRLQGLLAAQQVQEDPSDSSTITSPALPEDPAQDYRKALGLSPDTVLSLEVCHELCSHELTDNEAAKLLLALCKTYKYFEEKSQQRFADREKHKERYEHFKSSLVFFATQKEVTGKALESAAKSQFSTSRPGNKTQRYFDLFQTVATAFDSSGCRKDIVEKFYKEVVESKPNQIKF